MRYQITDEQIQRMRDICEDVQGCLECNCSGEEYKCEGSCTYSMAMAMRKEIDLLPTIYAMVPLPEPQARHCELCGAVEGQPHHDEAYRLLVTALEEHMGKLHCQPCLDGTLELENPAEFLLAKAARLQTEFWEALSGLESELGNDVDGNMELSLMSVDDLREAGEDA